VALAAEIRRRLEQARTEEIQAIAEASGRLAEAPAWFRPGLDPGRLSPEHAREAGRFEALADELKRRRTALDELEAGLARLDFDAGELAEVEAGTVEWFNGLRSGAQLRREVARDPANELSDPRGGISARLAAALVRYRDSLPERRIESLDDLRRAPGVDAAILADLWHTGLLLWRERFRPPRLRPTIGVLLPARLETRFDPPAGSAGSWRMRLRIVPDEPWLDSHEPVPTALELDTLDAFWAEAAGPGLGSPEGEAAWRRLAGAHGGGRAAWLTRTFPPVPGSEPPQVARPANPREEAGQNRLGGLPGQLEVWIARGGAGPALAATLTVDSAKLALHLGDPDDPDEERWWQSWDVAVDAGLATTIDLGQSSPADIDAVYVLGLGTAAPVGLFANQAAAGRLAVLPPGAPTNTVAGEPAADLGRDPLGWLPLVQASAAAQPATARLARALTGDPAALGPLPGGEADHTTAARALVGAVWPALWGHAFKDVWGLGVGVVEAGLWAAQTVAPEGPLPAVRIARQPYGVLPVTSLRGWTAAQGDPPIEATVAGPFAAAQALFAAAAEAGGTVDGADSARLLELVGGVPRSGGYAWRHMLSIEVALMLAWASGKPVDQATAIAMWDKAGKEALALLGEPERRHLAVGAPQPLEIPLVEPVKLDDRSFADALKLILGAPPAVLTQPTWLREVFRKGLPDSLLLRLLVRSLVLSAADAHRAAISPPGSARLEPLGRDDTLPTAVAADARAFDPQDLAAATPEALMFDVVRARAGELLDYPVEELERAFRATLDSASHRIDPFVTGVAERRLEATLASGRARHLLGLYAWVDRPFTGTPGPTAGGLLHAPSDAQALTAAILRDKALGDAEPQRWHMDLTSASVRFADRLGEEVRLGAHPSEALGREVERAVGVPAAIESLRESFPVRAEQAGRRVCDGLAVLAADPAGLPLSAGQRAALGPLRDAVDAYGDLLVAEAVHEVVRGRGEVAGAAMDAAAGLGRPPVLESIRTPRPGSDAHSTVVVALPAQSLPAASASASPARVADPAVAAHLDTAFGAADSAAWTWQTDDGGALTAVTLDDLGLDPVDTAALSDELLLRLVLEAAPAGSEVVARTGSDTHARVRRLMNTIASRPATQVNFVDGATDDGAARAELAARYQRLLDVGALLLADVTAAAAASATEAQRRAALAAVRRWGIVPTIQGDDAGLATQVERARAELAARLDRAAPAAEVAALEASAQAAALAELAVPDGRLAILARVPVADVPSLQALAADGSTGLSAFDRDWVAAVAAVRAPMARLELLQLEAMLDPAGAPLRCWSDRRDDPWQADVAPGPDGRRPPSRMLALFGPQGVMSGTEIAIGLVDAWGETIPETEHITSAAFGFSAPAARAPQAILLAVPPNPAQRLDGATIVEILAETRLAARARAADPAELGAALAALPSIMLPAAGPTAVEVGI
jgi:hypothetical protein